MKNKHGWGLNEMIIFCCIIIGFLLLTVFLVNSLYSGLKNQVKTDEENAILTYQDVEQNLKKAAMNYYRKEKYPDIDMVSSWQLIDEEYLEEELMIPKKEDVACDGYVTIKNKSVSKAYISCEHYETEGYEP